MCLSVAIFANLLDIHGGDVAHSKLYKGTFIPVSVGGHVQNAYWRHIWCFISQLSCFLFFRYGFSFRKSWYDKFDQVIPSLDIPELNITGAEEEDFEYLCKVCYISGCKGCRG